MVVIQVNAGGRVVFSGTGAPAAYLAYKAACGNPPNIKVTNEEEGFLWEGCYVCILPSK